MYPAISNWNSPDAGSAWIVYAPNGASNQVCQTNGWDFLVDLQTQLINRLQAAPGASWDGSVINGSNLSINDSSSPSSATGWNYPLLQALYAVASADGAPQSSLSAIQQDANSSSISSATLATALWVAEYNQGYVSGTQQTVFGQGSVNDIQIPSNISLPMFGVVPPVATAGTVVGLDCHTITGAPVGGAPSVSGVLVVTAVVVGIVAMVALTANLSKRVRE